MEMIGGQAVMEGVMIRNKNRVATAVRTKKGIIVNKQDFTSVTEGSALFRLPIIRGAIGLIETMVLGIRTLNWSTDMSLQEVDDLPVKKDNSFAIYVSVFIAILLGIGLFIFLPLWVTTFFFNIEKTSIVFNLIAGIIRLTLFIVYILLIARLNDVKKLFQYHGAEHKMVNCYENEPKASVKGCSKYTTIHNRCGTSFLLVVLIIAIIGFAILDSVVAYALGYTNLWIRLITHILFLPLILGVAYEIIRKAQNPNFFVKILISPGLLFQKITTKEPDEKQLEVALEAVKAVVAKDWKPGIVTITA